MIEYIEDMIQRTTVESGDEENQAMAGLQANLEKLKPVIDAHDKHFEELKARESEMDRLLHEFKNSLMIEKIKMDTWENKQMPKSNR